LGFSFFLSAKEVNYNYLGLTIEIIKFKRVLKNRNDKNCCSLQVKFVWPYSPAFNAGIRNGDIILSIDDKELSSDKKMVKKKIFEIIDNHNLAEPININIFRKKSKNSQGKDNQSKNFLRKRINLIKYFDHWLSKKELINNNLYPYPYLTDLELKKVVEALIKKHRFEDAFLDLKNRFLVLERRGDPFRSDFIASLHRDWFLTRKTIDRILESIILNDDWSDSIKNNLQLSLSISNKSKLYISKNKGFRNFKSFVDFINVIENAFKRVKNIHLKESLIKLTNSEKEFIYKEYFDLFTPLKNSIYLYLDKNRKRYINNLNLIKTASKINKNLLMQGAYELISLFNKKFIDQLVIQLKQERSDIYKEIVFKKETIYGSIIIAGVGDNRHVYQGSTKPALIIDLGGDDFYGGRVAASDENQDVSIVIDLSGDDIYQSSNHLSQGASILGIGILLDLEGDDSYISTGLSQGFSFMGVGSDCFCGFNGNYCEFDKIFINNSSKKA